MAQNTVTAVLQDMISYYESDPVRIHHLIKVHSLAALIAEEEGLDGETRLTLELAALVHDIGIKKAEELYGSSSGRYQEELGPDLAEEMLGKYDFTRRRIDRIRFLVGHHHSYGEIDGLDYRILVEADFLVNMLEDKMSDSAVAAACRKIFRTAAGKRICRTMYARAFA